MQHTVPLVLLVCTLKKAEIIKLPCFFISYVCGISLGPVGSFIMLKSPSQSGRQNPPLPQGRLTICDTGECHNNLQKQDEIKLDMTVCRGILRCFAKAYHISRRGPRGSFTSWFLYLVCEADHSFVLINVHFGKALCVLLFSLRSSMGKIKQPNLCAVLTWTERKGWGWLNNIKHVNINLYIKIYIKWNECNEMMHFVMQKILMSKSVSAMPGNPIKYGRICLLWLALRGFLPL